MQLTLEKSYIAGNPVRVDDLGGQMFGGEANAHKFVITQYAAQGSTETIAITGSVSGTLMASTGATVPLTGSLEDGKAVVVLDENCYSVPGRFVLSIFVTSGDVTLCIYCGVGNVLRTSGDMAAYPTEAIPNLAQLVAQVQAAIDSFPADLTAIQAAIAANYDDLPYPITAGTYAWHAGTLYKAKVNIATTEAWTAAHWETVHAASDLAAGLSSLKSALNDDTVNGKIISAWENKAISAYDGTTSDNQTRLKTVNPLPAWITDITPSENFMFGLFAFDGDTYIGWWKTDSWSKGALVWRTESLHIGTEISASNYDLYVVLRKTEGQNISVSDLSGISFNSISDTTGHTYRTAKDSFLKLKSTNVSGSEFIWVHKAVTVSDGSTFDANTRYLLNIPVQDRFVGIDVANNYKYALFAYNSSGVYIGCWTGNAWGTATTIWFENEIVFNDSILSNGYNIYVLLRRVDDETMSTNDLDGISFKTTTSFALQSQKELQTAMSNKLESPSAVGANGQALLSDGNGGQYWGDVESGGSDDTKKAVTRTHFDGSAVAWEAKSISAYNGSTSDNPARYKTVNPLPSFIARISVVSGYEYAVFAYNGTNYIGWWRISGWSQGALQWRTDPLILDNEILKNGYDLYMVFKNTAGTALSSSDLENVVFDGIPPVAADNDRDLYTFDASTFNWTVGFIYSSNGTDQDDRPQGIRTHRNAFLAFQHDVRFVCTNPLITEIYAYKYNADTTYVERFGGKVHELTLPKGYLYRLAMLTASGTVVTASTLTQYTANIMVTSDKTGRLVDRLFDLGETGDYVLTTESIRKPIRLELLGTIYREQSFLMYNGKYYSTYGNTVAVQSANFTLDNEYELSLGHGNSFQLGTGSMAYISGWDDQTVYVLDLTDLSAVNSTIALPTTGYTTVAIDDVNKIAYIFQRNDTPSTVGYYNFIVYDYDNQQIISTKKINQPMAAMQAVDFLDGRIYVLNGAGENAKPNGYRVFDTNGTLLYEYVIGSRYNKEPEGVFVDRTTKIVYISYMDGNLYRIRPAV